MSGSPQGSPKGSPMGSPQASRRGTPAPQGSAQGGRLAVPALARLAVSNQRRSAPASPSLGADSPERESNKKGIRLFRTAARLAASMSRPESPKAASRAGSPPSGRKPSLAASVLRRSSVAPASRRDSSAASRRASLAPASRRASLSGSGGGATSRRQSTASYDPAAHIGNEDHSKTMSGGGQTGALGRVGLLMDALKRLRAGVGEPEEPEPRLSWKEFFQTIGWHLMRPSEPLEFNSEFRLSFNRIVFIVMMWNAFIVPFAIGLRDIADSKGLLYTAYAFDYLGDITYLIDIWLSLKTTFLRHGLAVTDIHLIRAKYLTDKWFVGIDVLSIVPVDLFFFFNPLNHYLCRTNRLLRLSRLGLYFDHWEHYTRNVHTTRLIKLGIGLMLAVHFVGCGYIIFAYASGLGSSSYFPSEDFSKLALWEQYVFVFYWGASSSLWGGQGVAEPQETGEFLYNLVVVFISVFAFASVISSLNQIVTNLNAAQEQFLEKQDQINIFMDQRGLPSAMQQRVRAYFDYLWSRQQGVNDQEVLEQLPPHMRSDISQYLHRDLIFKVPFFADCVPGFINSLVQRLEPRIYSPGDSVIRSGELGREMFFLRQGRVKVLSTVGKVLAHLEEGSFFGEIALLFSVKRTASVVSEVFSDILVLTRSDLDAVLEQYPEQRFLLKRVAEARLSNDALRDLIRSVPMFKDSPKKFISELAGKLRPHQYSTGDYIIRVGEWSQEMYFLSSGTVEVLSSNGKLLKELEKGSFFGEIALMLHTQRTASIRATADCDIFVLNRKDLYEVLEMFPSQKGYFEKVAEERLAEDKSRKGALLRKVPVFEGCNDAFMDCLANHLKNQHYSEEDFIIREGEVGKEMFILNSGTVQVLNRENEVVAELNDGTVFGEIALLTEGSQRTASIRAASFCDVFVLTKHDLEQVLEGFPDEHAIINRVAESRLAQDKQRLLDFLVSAPSFSTMGEDFLDQLVGIASIRRYPRGDYLIRFAQESTPLLIIYSGNVEVLSSTGEVLTNLSAGAMVGEISIVLERPTTAAVRATNPVETMVVDRDALLDLLQEDPQAAETLLHIATQRLQRSGNNISFADLLQQRTARQGQLPEVDGDEADAGEAEGANADEDPIKQADEEVVSVLGAAESSSQAPARATPLRTLSPTILEPVGRPSSAGSAVDTLVRRSRLLSVSSALSDLVKAAPDSSGRESRVSGTVEHLEQLTQDHLESLDRKELKRLRQALALTMARLAAVDD